MNNLNEKLRNITYLLEKEKNESVKVSDEARAALIVERDRLLKLL